MEMTLVELVLNSPKSPEALLKTAFPGVRDLIVEEAYLSDTDENIFQRFLRNVLEPAVATSSDTIKSGLRACLEPRGAAAIAVASTGANFVCGFLPSYPPGLTPAVAAFVVLCAHELRYRGFI